MNFPKSRPWERHSSQSTLFGGNPRGSRKWGGKENGSYPVKGVLLSRLPLGHLELNFPGNCGSRFEIHTLASSWSRDEGAGEFSPQVPWWGLLLQGAEALTFAAIPEAGSLRKPWVSPKRWESGVRPSGKGGTNGTQIKIPQISTPSITQKIQGCVT